MPTPNPQFDAGHALSRIEATQQTVTARRRWRARTFVLVGLVTVAYFAVLGSIHYGMAGLVGTVMTLVPTIAAITLADIWRKHQGLESRAALRFEYILAGIYAVLTCVAGVLAVTLPHPVPAAFAGVLPGLVCLVGALRVTRQ